MDLHNPKQCSMTEGGVWAWEGGTQRGCGDSKGQLCWAGLAAPSFCLSCCGFIIPINPHFVGQLLENVPLPGCVLRTGRKRGLFYPCISEELGARVTILWPGLVETARIKWEKSYEEVDMETVQPPGFPLNVVFGTQLSSSPEGLSVWLIFFL